MSYVARFARYLRKPTPDYKGSPSHSMKIFRQSYGNTVRFFVNTATPFKKNIDIGTIRLSSTRRIYCHKKRREFLIVAIFRQYGIVMLTLFFIYRWIPLIETNIFVKITVPLSFMRDELFHKVSA